MKLLVGLGNPGPQYIFNRHNVGFLALDMLVQEYQLPAFKTKDRSLMTEGSIGNQKCVLLKPLTYMNNSGPAVAQVAQFYKLPLSHIFVFHDELDLPFGKVRTKVGGGAGGHNGLRSLDAHLGKDYHRIRIGIDHPGHKDLVSGHVLGNFNKAEQQELPFILGALADHLPLALNDHVDQFQSKVAEQLKVT
jgi:PTH1 family peptidyl-tRNA hydrolase